MICINLVIFRIITNLPPCCTVYTYHLYTIPPVLVYMMSTSCERKSTKIVFNLYVIHLYNTTIRYIHTYIHIPYTNAYTSTYMYIVYSNRSSPLQQPSNGIVACRSRLTSTTHRCKPVVDTHNTYISIYVSNLTLRCTL